MNLLSFSLWWPLKVACQRVGKVLIPSLDTDHRENGILAFFSLRLGTLDNQMQKLSKDKCSICGKAM